MHEEILWKFSNKKNNPLSTILPSGMFHEVSRNSSSIDTLVYLFIHLLHLFVHPKLGSPNATPGEGVVIRGGRCTSTFAGLSSAFGKKHEIQYNTIHIISYNTTQGSQKTQHDKGRNTFPTHTTLLPKIQQFGTSKEPTSSLSGSWRADPMQGNNWVLCVCVYIYIYTQYIYHVISYILQVDFIFVYG